MAAERLRPAGNDGAHHPFLDTAKVSGMGKAPGLAMAAQNIGHLDAGAIPCGCGAMAGSVTVRCPARFYPGGITSSDRRSNGLCVARIVWVATCV